MRDAVMVVSSFGRSGWLEQCVASLGNVPYFVVCVEGERYGFELGKLRWAYENTNFDRFFFLQDSVVVKDLRLFDLAFSHPGSVSLCNYPYYFGMYMGVYSREVLSRVGIPFVNNKEEAIHQEFFWTQEYCKVAGNNFTNLFWDLTDYDNKGIVEKFGRKNLVLENNYLIKYKGTWAGMPTIPVR